MTECVRKKSENVFKFQVHFILKGIALKCSKIHWNNPQISTGEGEWGNVNLY